MALTIVVEAELSAGVWTAITSDTLGASGLTFDWGMDGGRPDDNCARPGTFTLTLDNAAKSGALVGRYSPGHTNALSGWNLNTALRVTLSNGPTSRVMGPYRVVSITPEPNEYGDKTVSVTAADWLEDAAQAPVASEGLSDVWPGVLVASLVSGMATAPASTSLDAGAAPFVYPLTDASSRRDRVLAAFKSVAQSDGGHLYLTSAGVLTYRAAAARAASTTADFSFLSGMHGLSASRNRDGLVNSMRLTVHPPIVSATLVVVASVAAPFLVPAGGAVSLVLSYRDPDTGNACGILSIPHTPEEVTDWLANSREDGLGTDLGSNFVVEHDNYTNASVTVLVSNLGAEDGYITFLQVRAVSVVDQDPITVQAVNSASVTAYGERILDVDLPYQHDPNIAQALADYWSALYSDAAMRADALSVLGTSAWEALVLGVDVGSRLVITEAMTGLAAQSYWVQGVTMTVTEGPVFTVDLRLAPASDTLYWLLGTAGRSELDSTTVLGYL